MIHIFGNCRMRRAARLPVCLVMVAMIFSAVSSLQAAKIDPDFRPIYAFGFGDERIRVATTMADGRIVVESGRYSDDERTSDRLLLDGSIDPGFDPSLEGMLRYSNPSAARFAAWYDETDPELVWLNDAGQRTEVVFRFNEDAGGRFLTYPGDQVLLFGDFTSVNDVTRYRLARINADGTIDLSFDAGVLTHEVEQVVALSDGRILVRGTFQSLGGFDAPGLARLHADGTVDSNFSADDLGHVYHAGPVAEDSKGRILRTYSGVCYRSDPNGGNSQILVEWSPESAGARGLLPMGNDSFLIWGDFTEIGGVDRAFLAMVNEDGTVDTGFDANAVFAIGSEPTGRSINNVVRLSDGRIVVDLNVLLPDGSVDPSFQPVMVNPGAVNAAALQEDGLIVVGGQFTHSGAMVRTGLDRLDDTGVSDPTFDPGPGSTVMQIASIAVGPDGSIWVGGGPTDIASVPGANLARHDVNGRVDPDFHLAFSEDARVKTIATDEDGRVIFGGRFTMVEGHVRNGLARLNPDHTLDMDFANEVALSGQNVEVIHVEVLPGGDVLVAGTFDAWRGQRRWGLLKLDSDGTLKSDFVPNEALVGLRVTAAAGHDGGSVGVAALTDETRPFSSIYLLDSSGQEIISMPSSVTGYADVAVAVAIPGGDTVFSVVPVSYGYLDANSRYLPFLLTLRPDGTRDHALMAEVDVDEVRDMAVTPDGRLVVVGDFDGFDAVDYAGILRVFDLAEPLTPRLADISTRGQVLGGGRDLIAGFVVEGNKPLRVMIRGVGPTLKEYGIEDAVNYPRLEVCADPAEPPIFTGGYWWIGDRYGVSPDPRIIDMANRVGAFPLTLADPEVTRDSDAVVILDLVPGIYTVRMSGRESGVGLVEVYNATGIEADRRITNLSTRGWVGVDKDRLLGGFVIEGGAKCVLVRAIGPALEDFGVTDSVDDPYLMVVRTKTIEEVGANDNWGEDGSGQAIIEASALVGAFPLQPGKQDSALILTLEPGAYTAIVSGVGRTTGIGLVEVYELPEE